ncbi:MAG: DUF1016 N-terminal domain-containing protein [Bacteroidota bacterium]
MKNLPINYNALLEDIKSKVQQGRIHAMQQVSRTLVSLYWNIGQLIVEHQTRDGWGKSTVEQLSLDLKVAFPNQNSFSTRNLWLMRQFYQTYSNYPNVKQLVSEILQLQMLTSNKLSKPKSTTSCRSNS